MSAAAPAAPTLAPPPADVLRALASLRLAPPAPTPSPLDDESTYLDVACTLAEEADHTGTFNAPSPTDPGAAAALAALLTSRGFAGGPDDRAAALDFLAAEAQSARLAAARRPAVEEHGAADVSLAASLARVCAAVGWGAGVGVVDGARDADGVGALVRALVGRVREEAEEGRWAEERVLVEAAPRDARMREVGTVCEALAAEFELRKGLLLTRLEVTVRSFGYSARAGEDGFRGVLRGVVRALESGERGVGVYDALVAREGLLRVRRVSAGRGDLENVVKDVLMGNVPDRGGRVGAAAAAKANMPRFQARAAGRGQGRGRGRGKGRCGRR